MMAVTVRQPWAHAIMHLGKNVENRTWSTEYRGPLAIHAGKTFDYEGQAKLEKRGHDMLVDMPGGVIVGVVDLVACHWVTPRQNRWMSPTWGVGNCYHWLLDNPRPLDQPIPWRGQQGLFYVNHNQLTYLLDA